MLRRVKMVLPLFFAFLLTLLPFLLLEFTQAQRVIVQQERELYLWEQQANNYLQLFINLWSPEFQLRRRLDVFRRRDAAKTFRSRNLQQAFASGISKRLSGMWKPDYLYAGSFNKATGKFKMFQGRPFSNLNKLVFSTIMQGLAKEGKLSEFDAKKVNRFSQGALGEDITIDFLKTLRRGKFNGSRYLGKNSLFMWDYMEEGDMRIVYMVFYEDGRISNEESVTSVQQILAKRFPDVLSALIPIEEADKSLKPIFENRLEIGQRTMINQICQSPEIFLPAAQNRKNKGVARDELLPVGLSRKLKDQYLIREFVDYHLPFEILLLRPDLHRLPGTGEYFVFIMRLLFFSLWFLTFAKVIISGRPLGLSIASWLTLIFMVVGVFPLVVLYIAGSLHLEASAFRREQQSVKEIISQFEEVDISGDAILGEYREFCRELEIRDSWKNALKTWDRDVWIAELEKTRELFKTAGLRFAGCFVYPPPIARSKENPKERMPYLFYSFYGDDADRDKALSEFYSTWVDKAYFKIASYTTNFEDTQLSFFAGQEGDEILRLFMGNRGDSDLVDMGDQKHFFYQNYILDNGKMKNWFFLRANLNLSYETYLRERVNDWINVYSHTDGHRLASKMHFALARFGFPEPQILLPEQKKDDKYLGVIIKNAGDLIELAVATRAQLFRQTDHQISIVYPCRKTGDYVLTAVMDFRNLHYQVYLHEIKLAALLIFLAIPIFFVSRFIANYLVKPFKKVEGGLKRVAEDDFSVPIRLKRNDEIGQLSDAFDKMVDGIIERKNLGRFVSADLDNKVARESSLSRDRLEKSFAAVLCSDIRSFTTLSETYPVRDVVMMLNEHLEAMSEVITSNGGMIEQFIGDAILAVFYAETDEEASVNAVRAGVGMVKAHAGLLRNRKKENLFSYQIGVGIEVGQVLSGVIDAGEKNEYVLIGQCRSQAEVLEGKSKIGRFSRIICSPQVKKFAKEFDFKILADNHNWEIVLPEGKS
jgi:class 3 adenylate cyclase